MRKIVSFVWFSLTSEISKRTACWSHAVLLCSVKCWHVILLSCYSTFLWESVSSFSFFPINSPPSLPLLWKWGDKRKIWLCNVPQRYQDKIKGTQTSPLSGVDLHEGHAILQMMLCTSIGKGTVLLTQKNKNNCIQNVNYLNN